MTRPTPLGGLTELKAVLQLAIGVRLSIIPVHLAALWSIEEGRNTGAARTIRGVVMEEMLHLTLTANVLNALGETPSPAPVAFRGHEHLSPLSDYPVDNPLIAGIGTLRLLPLSPQAVDCFVRIRHPLHGAADVREIEAGACGYRTAGEFHDAIATALADPAICPDTVFRHRHQVPDSQYYGGAGQVVEVGDRASALRAVRMCSPSSSPYARFRELRTGHRFRTGQSADEEPRGDLLPVDYGAVHPALFVPRDGDPAEGPETAALIEFDLAYSRLVDVLYAAFCGERTALATAVHGMYALRHRAVALMRTPLPADPAHTLCPRFSYLPPGDREKAARQAGELRERGSR
ncbi:ferritin-like domain-containing protein [Streptomyces sp. NPDC051315]|uniref:ferritin-like domain-containing protein n=1 Tax=Streptomyces sp. NPDC051315 TaxID=3365650 RepID=UPI0037A7737A